MPFSKPAPNWGAPGVKPPDSKLTEGWQVDEHPPAGWFDWFFYTTSQILTELKAYSLHSELLGVKNGIATLNASGKVPASQLDIQAPSDATTTTKGIVQLNSATNSIDETTAATPKAVKAAYDLANGKYSKPTNGIPKADLEQAVKDTLDNVLLKGDKGAVNGVASLDAKKRVQQEQAIYSVYKTNKDANGIYTTVEFKRPDATLSKRSVLSNPDTNGNYQTQTITYFDTNGTTSLGNDVFTITYDSDGNVITEVMQ